MKWEQVKIASVVLPIQRWNPARVAPDEELDYIDLSSVDKDSKTITGITTYIGSEAPSRAQQLVRTGDILVSTVRPNLNGVAYVSQDFDGVTASTGYCVLRPDTTRIDPRYLFHWVKTQAFIDEMVKKSTGANYPAVSDNTVKNSEMPLPPLPIQQRIAAVLDEVDALRQKREQSVELLSRIQISQFASVLNGSSTVKYLTLQEACKKITDGTHHMPEESDGGIPILRVLNIKDNKIDKTNLRHISQKDYDDISKRSPIELGDVLFTILGTIGNSAIFKETEPYTLVRNIAILKPNVKLILPNYLLNVLKIPSVKAQIRSRTKQSAQSALYLNELKQITIPIIDIKEQENLISFISSVEYIRHQAQESEKMFKYLFHSLQTGAYSSGITLRSLEATL